MSPTNLIKARAMAERWDEEAATCLPEEEHDEGGLVKREPAE